MVVSNKLSVPAGAFSKFLILFYSVDYLFYPVRRMQETGNSFLLFPNVFKIYICCTAPEYKLKIYRIY